MKPHIKVIQRNGADIFVTSSMVMKLTKAEIDYAKGITNADTLGQPGLRGACGLGSPYTGFSSTDAFWIEHI